MASIEEKLQKYRDLMADYFDEFCEETREYIDEELEKVGE